MERLDGDLQIAIGGGDHADVELHFGGRADRADSTFLQCGAAWVEAQRHVADFVEQQCPAACLDQQTFAGGSRVGRGALRMSKQLAFQQRLGKGRAIDRQELDAAAHAPAMHALATSSFPVPLAPMTNTVAFVSAMGAS